MNPRLLTVLLSFSTLSSPVCAQPETIVIKNVSIVDVVGGRLVADQTVAIQAGMIVAAGAAAAVSTPAGARIVDGKDRYLMPGLWDMHVHFRSYPVDRRPLVAENAAMLELFVINGVVGVREMGGDLSEHVILWRGQIRAGTLVGPRILTAGRKLEGPNPRWPGSIVVAGPEQARQAVRQIKASGADFIKVYFDDVEVPVFKAVTEEAHKLGLKVTGHLPKNLRLQVASDLGLDGIEHSMTLQARTSLAHDQFVEEANAREKTGLRMDVVESSKRRIYLHDMTEEARLYPLLASRLFYVTPTVLMDKRVGYEAVERDFSTDPLQRYFHPAIWGSWNTKTGRRAAPSGELLSVMKRRAKQSGELAVAAHRAGVPLLAGTDCGVSNNYVLPGWSIHEELETLVQFGLTPAEALRTATVNPARWRGEEALEGSVDRGKRADLLLLRANPLSSIRATREIESVFLRGEYYPKSRLTGMLEAVALKSGAAQHPPSQ